MFEHTPMLPYLRSAQRLLEDIAANVRQLREDRGLSVAELAAHIGRPPAFVEELQAGQAAVTLRDVVRLAQVERDVLVDRAHRCNDAQTRGVTNH